MSAKNTSFTEFHTINCAGNLVDLSTPKVMGIINITPDSFYNGGKTTTKNSVLKLVEEMVQEGVTFIDIGGMSSRPGAKLLTSDEECARVLDVIAGIKKTFPEVLISIDTIHSQTARKSVEAGATIVNDISGGNFDLQMIPIVAELGVPYIAMHMRGTPGNMQENTNYDHIVQDIINYFITLVNKCSKEGIEDIIIDPGFGFAKTLQQNYILLNRLKDFQLFGRPLLVGVSRKSMIYKTLNIRPDDALNGTTALNMAALINGAKILRVHDVKEAVETIKLFEQLSPHE